MSTLRVGMKVLASWGGQPMQPATVIELSQSALVHILFDGGVDVWVANSSLRLHPNQPPTLTPDPAPGIAPTPAPDLTPIPPPSLPPSPLLALSPRPSPDITPSPVPDLTPNPLSQVGEGAKSATDPGVLAPSPARERGLGVRSVTNAARLLADTAPVALPGATDAGQVAVPPARTSLPLAVMPVLAPEPPAAQPVAPAPPRVESSILAESLPGILGHHRIRVRLLRGTDAVQPGDPAESVVALRVAAEHPAQLKLREVSPPLTATEQGHVLRVEVGWTEWIFSLEGSSAGLAQIELVAVSGLAAGTVKRVSAWFPVTVVRAEPVSPPPAPPAAPPPPAVEELVRASAPPSSPRESIDDDRVNQVLRHIDRHGAITEKEAIGLLGGARAFRRFSAEFERHAETVPFRVRIEASAEGKRYVKEGDK